MNDNITLIILGLIFLHLFSFMFTTMNYQNKTDNLCLMNDYMKAENVYGIYPYTTLKYVMCSNPVIINEPGINPMIVYTTPVRMDFEE